MPFGVVAGTTARPMVSMVSAWMRRANSASHSFQSESSWTRPCCMTTPRKSFQGLKVKRLLSKLMLLSIQPEDTVRTPR